MNNKTFYRKYMNEVNVDGSNKASSYIRAIELLQPILKAKGGSFSDCAELYSVSTAKRVGELYDFLIEQQSLAEKGIFGGEEPPSYWRNRYYSAAVKTYKEFLVLFPYKQRLWELYEGADVTAGALADQLASEELNEVEEIIDDVVFDFASKEGKEKLRQVKTRVNQSFFREMILSEYNSQCCLTELNVPAVLRASHIVGWQEDKTHRLNPSNGLCLSATYDAAFDRHLISLDEDCRLILSSELKEHHSNEAFKTHFLAFEGRSIILPKRFHPDPVFLEHHRSKMPG